MRTTQWHRRNHAIPPKDGRFKWWARWYAREIRDWHPDFDIGDTVRRIAPKFGDPTQTIVFRHAVVEAFEWGETIHIQARVRFDNDVVVTVAARDYELVEQRKRRKSKRSKPRRGA